MGALVFKAIAKNESQRVASTAQSLFEFNANKIDGVRVNLGDICSKAQCTLVVNVATNWGLTDVNYRELVELYNEYGAKGFQILAFPCNQFGGQEPGTNQQIAEWAKATYGVTFPMFEKTEVNGDRACEVYQYLRMNSELYDPATKTAKTIPWNFAKFLIDSNGKVFKYHGPRDNPISFRDVILNMCSLWKNGAPY